MLKFFKSFIVSALIVLAPCSSFALEPQDALSARVKEPIYITARMDDLGGTLREIFSISNIEMFASLAEPQDAQQLRFFAGMASQVPIKSVAFAAGVTSDIVPFFQIAVSYPDSLKPKLDLVASGKATQEDLAALILGDSGAAFAPLIQTKTLDGKGGKYYSISDAAFLAAKDNLLLLSLSQANLDESLAALGDAKKRLVIKRRFSAPNYKFIHMDMSTLASVIPDDEQDISFKNTLKFFKAPMDIEFAFESKPEKFTVSVAMNVLESIVGLDKIVKTIKASKTGDTFVGSGRPYFGVSGFLTFNEDGLALYTELYPKYAKIWSAFTDKLSDIGIDKTDLENLFGGSIAFASAGKTSVMGQTVPGLYVAVTGKNGVAEKILGKILGNEKFTASAPLAPLKVKGWDAVYQVDPKVAPASVVLGRTGETLFFGAINPDELDKKPDFAPEVADIMQKETFGVVFIDTQEIWKYLRTVVASGKGSFKAQIDALDPVYVKAIDDILGADLLIRLINIWSPTIDTGIMEFSLSDVPAEKRLLPRIIKAARDIDEAGDNFDEDAEEEE
ncbi:hypothetical protein FACS1894204_12950 [Synergistales bacterium]|nr:hypothetical protein FACS1894204_12950 [Synergistales bacterium]